MFQIKICSVYDVQDMAEDRAAMLDVRAVLSIDYPNRHPRDKVPDLQGKNGIVQKTLCFWDVEQKSSHIDDFRPAPEHIEQSFAFLDSLRGLSEDDTVIVHCKAGKSRSVAIALAWLAKETGVENAIDKIKREIRPNIAAPNIALIELAEDYVESLGNNRNVKCSVRGLTQAVMDDPLFTSNRDVANAKRFAQMSNMREAGPKPL